MTSRNEIWGWYDDELAFVRPGFRHPNESALLIPTSGISSGPGHRLMVGCGVRVGDFAKFGKNVSELPHATLAEVLSPLGFDLGDDARRKR